VGGGGCVSGGGGKEGVQCGAHILGARKSKKMTNPPLCFKKTGKNRSIHERFPDEKTTRKGTVQT